MEETNSTEVDKGQEARATSCSREGGDWHKEIPHREESSTGTGTQEAVESPIFGDFTIWVNKVLSNMIQLSSWPCF